MDKKAENEPTAPPGQVEPPTESPRAVWTRRLVLLAFWVVVVCFGVPIWTWTTSIHRSALPLDDMYGWAEGERCQLQSQLLIRVQSDSLSDAQITPICNQLESLLTAKEDLPLYQFRVLPGESSVGDVLTVVLDTNSNPDTSLPSLHPWLPQLTMGFDPQTKDILPLATLLSEEIYKAFTDENIALAHTLQSTPFGKTIQTTSLDQKQQQALELSSKRAFKYASTYHLTFSLFTPLATPSAWEIDQAIRDYIQPLLTSLSAINDFSIDTQVQLYATFSPSIAGPSYDNATQSWRLQYEDLTGFINAAEWPLSPSIGSGPTINFVLYVPSADKSPLLIDASEGTSWIIPQWGAVQIHNPSPTQSETLTVEDLHADMLVFADQLASLLGLPRSPPSLSLRISSLTRQRAVSLILSASSTLGALRQLAWKLKSIAIPHSVADSVDETLRRLDQACSDLRAGHIEAALENARTAEAEAEQAFFEPSMVGQVYFPEEHKVAVYVPLLGPMAVPLIMAGIKELRALRSQKRKTA